MATPKPLDIELTSAEAAIVRRVFFPLNPSKMRSADAQVVTLAKRMVLALDKRAHGPGAEWDGPLAGTTKDLPRLTCSPRPAACEAPPAQSEKRGRI